MNNLYIKLKKELKYIALSLVIGFMVTFTVGFTTENYAEGVNEDLAESVLRLHIRANSDEAYDQELKIKVRDALLKEFEPELKGAETKEELINIINENHDRIIETAEKTIKENGYNYSVTANIGEAYLETKKYGNVYLPAGNYDALIIKIGSGQGHNWWCVLYPPLCYVGDNSVVSGKDKEILQSNLTKEEYDLITNQKDLDIKFKFKVVEYWGKYKGE